jgi:hypothetical protein
MTCKVALLMYAGALFCSTTTAAAQILPTDRTTTWNPGVPGGILAQQTLPASLYLSAKPAFFGYNPWQWVDPTGTAKLNVLPAKARYDAILSGGAGAPSAPTGLIVQ